MIIPNIWKINKVPDHQPVIMALPNLLFQKKERVVKNGTNSWMMIFPEFSSSTGALTTAQTDNGPDEKWGRG